MSEPGTTITHSPIKQIREHKIQSANPRNAEAYGWAVAIAIPLLIALMVIFIATAVCQLVQDLWKRWTAKIFAPTGE